MDANQRLEREQRTRAPRPARAGPAALRRADQTAELAGDRTMPPVGRSTAEALTPGTLLNLQRAAGNGGVARLVAAERAGGLVGERAGRGSGEEACEPVVARLPPGPELERCVAWMTKGEDPEDESRRFTDRDATYTLINPKQVSKRFTSSDGRSWMVMIRFPAPRRCSDEEARRRMDAFAEQVYRGFLRYARSVARQLCEQSDLPVPGKEYRVVQEPDGEIVSNVPGQQASAQTPPATTVPSIDQPLVIDGFAFNGWAVPTSGSGRAQLDKLCSLPDETKARIRITRIEGHTDHVPVRRYGRRRFRSLGELSKRRAMAVRARLEEAGLAPPKEIEPLADAKAGVARTESNEKRAVDRKVVVHWEIA